MKRIICLMLVFAMLLTACSNKSAGTDSSNTAESTAEPEKQKENIENKEETLRHLSSRECIDWNTGISLLYELGISYVIRNINVVDDWYWNAELVLRKYENDLVLPVEGLYYYSGDMIMAPYGAFEIYDDYIVYAGKGKAVSLTEKALKRRTLSRSLTKETLMTYG